MPPASQTALKRIGASIGFAALVAAGSGYAAAQEPTFDWPVPAEVVVGSKTLKNGRSMDSRFTVVTEADGSDGTFTVTLDKFEILTFNGEPIDTDEERRAMAPTQALMAFVPGFRVAADGELVSLVDYDLDAMLTELRDYITRHAAPDARVNAVLDQAFERMKSPVMQAQIEAQIGDIWSSWVGFWRNVSFTETGTQTFDTEIPVFGRTLTQTIEVRNLGEDTACDGCVRLRAEAVLEGPELRDSMLAMLRQQIPDGASTQQKDEFEAFARSVEGYRRELVMEIATDPATLRPAYVLREAKVVLLVQGAAPKERLDRSAWTFDWTGSNP